MKPLLTSHQAFCYFLSVSIWFVFYLFPLNCPPCIIVAGGENCSESSIISWVWILTSSVYFFNTISTFSSGEPSLFRLCNKDVTSLPTRQAFSVQIREWKDKEDEQKPTRESSALKLQNKSTGEVVESQRDCVYDKMVERSKQGTRHLLSLKGIVHPEMNLCHYLFTLLSFKTLRLSFFLYKSPKKGKKSLKALSKWFVTFVYCISSLQKS